MTRIAKETNSVLKHAISQSYNNLSQYEYNGTKEVMSRQIIKQHLAMNNYELSTVQG